MFTIEHDFDATIVTLVDDPAGHRQEDITITAFEDCVTIEQLDPRTEAVQTVTLSLSQVAGLEVGSVIELDSLAGEPLVIYANGRRIASGDAVVVDGQFGIRIQKMG